MGKDTRYCIRVLLTLFGRARFWYAEQTLNLLGLVDLLSQQGYQVDYSKMIVMVENMISILLPRMHDTG